MTGSTVRSFPLTAREFFWLIVGELETPSFDASDQTYSAWRHSYFPVDRVRRTALALAKSLDEPVDLIIVELAALFHDLTVS